MCCWQKNIGSTFELIEATIPDIQAALVNGQLTSEQLTKWYLERIIAYDHQGPSLRAIIALNPQALVTATELDKERRLKGGRGPLHGIPIILKDNFDTYDLPTTAGSISLHGSVPPDDAFVVKKLRAAGAIILAKANMHEFAAGFATASSEGGQTLNPYDLTRIPGGSSGGTAAAIAANFAAAGIGTDSGGSVRIPSSFNSLVGIRPTYELVSRDGIVPLVRGRDVAGPIARTVIDAALLLDIMTGVDSADLATRCSDQPAGGYTRCLDANSLRGAKIGVLRQLTHTPDADPDVVLLVNQAVADLVALGADVLDPLDIPGLTELLTNTFYNTFEYDMNNYLQTLGSKAPFKTVQDFIASGKYLSAINGVIFSSLKGNVAPESDPAYADFLQRRDSSRMMLERFIKQNKLDAILYPTLTQSAPLISDPSTLYRPPGGLTQKAIDISPYLGFPAITVPGGFTSLGLPVGIELLGAPFTEGTLIGLAYSYEQATKHRRPPKSTP